MRRKRPSTIMNLDSLLDTVTNVVGFLVIVLAVMQLNAVHMGKDLAAPEAPAPAASGAELDAKIQEFLARLTALANQMAESHQALASQPDRQAAEQDAKTIGDLIRELLAQMDKIKAKIAQAREELGNLGKQVKNDEETLARTPPPEPEVLPDIEIVQVSYSDDDKKANRLAWPSEQLEFICRKGRVFPLDSKTLETKLMDASRRCLGIPPGGRISVDSSKAQKLVAYFEQHAIQDEYIRIRLECMDLGFTVILRAIYEPRSDQQGQTTEELARGGSRHEAVLGNRNPQRTWVKYYVYNDSFETYRAARDIAKKKKFLIGWRPVDIADKFLVGLMGGGPNVGPGT